LDFRDFAFLFACGTRLCKKKNLLSYSQFVGTYDKKTRVLKQWVMGDIDSAATFRP
jgi:hypothetical protein